MRYKLLHVLLIEDSRDDADLVMLELKEAFPGAVGKRVDTMAEMSMAIKSGRWDVIVSDFNLPRFCAHDALAVLRKSGMDIPFIVMSGCVGEERAVSLMKEGASDFVTKNKLARLVPVIERELRDAATRRERSQAQERLRENERLLDGITAALGEGIFVLNSAGVLVFMNPEAERLLDWAARELRGKDMHRLIHAQKPDGTPLPESCCGILGVLRDGKVYRTSDDVFARKDGSLVPVSFVASPIIKDGNVAAVAVAFQDIGQRKQAEQDLLESREQLRELSAHLQTVREEERTRIARELHDELGQMLTGVKLDAKWLGNRLSGEQPDVVGKIGAMSQLIDGTLDAMRRVAADLRPMMLDDLGLAAAIEWLAEDFGERTGIGTRLEMDVEDGLYDGVGTNGELDTEVATTAFRIVQECLTNAARHAQAGQVLILLECHHGKLVLMVSDNGKGMPPAGKGKSSSLGIIGMRERIRGVGGKFYLFSIPGDGTTVLAIIPVKMTSHAEEMQ